MANAKHLKLDKHDLTESVLRHQLANIETACAHAVWNVNGVITQAMIQKRDTLRRRTGLTFDAVNGVFQPYSD